MGSSRALLELALSSGGSSSGNNGDVSSTCHENEKKRIEPAEEEENLAEEEEEEEEEGDERVLHRHVPSPVLRVSWDQDTTAVYVRVAVPRYDRPRTRCPT